MAKICNKPNLNGVYFNPKTDQILVFSNCYLGQFFDRKNEQLVQFDVIGKFESELETTKNVRVVNMDGLVKLGKL